MSKEVKKEKNENIGYKGQVEVGIIRNGKKFKKVTANEGTFALFRYLCDCLTGTINPNYDINKRPGNLKLYNSGSAILSYGIHFTDIKIVENAAAPSCSVVYNFLIPGSIAAGKKISSVKLFDLTDTVEYASANFNNTITVEDSDVNVYVSWTLTILNGRSN